MPIRLTTTTKKVKKKKKTVRARTTITDNHIKQTNKKCDLSATEMHVKRKRGKGGIYQDMPQYH